MTYNRIATPRMYLDQISYNLTTGFKTISVHSLSGTPSSGSFEDLFDLRPSNYVTWAAATEPVVIIIDTGFSGSILSEANFLAILGHNMEYAGARFKLSHDDDVNFASEEVITNNVANTSLINSAYDSGGFCEPENNGWSLITWSENSTNNRYYRIKFEKDSAAAFTQDLKVGAIMLGEYIDFPNSPDLDVGFNIDYDGTKLLTSAGGGSFAASSGLGSPAWAKTNPWVIAPSSAENETTKLSRHYGRRKYDMNFSYVADTDLFLSNMHAAHGGTIDGSDLYSQFYHKSLGQHQPFLFSIDGASTGEGDYGLYRLADSEIKTKQVAHQAWNTSLSLVESW